ncbi:MAG: hypothetical protein LBM96_08080 [Methanobrevibacter sp.]|jgi:hypothetical protein|nr:hypothetical protein [Candidatus Methanoflexus mossambicus]
MGLKIYGEPIAYGEENDMRFAVRFGDENSEGRKEVTEYLINIDKLAFKIFIEIIIKPFIEMGTLNDPINELLRINTEKFLNDDIVEYI